MTPDILYWQYKNKGEIETLDDKTLLKLYKDLSGAIKLFNDHKTPMTDEMFWQLVVVPNEIKRRNLNL